MKYMLDVDNQLRSEIKYQAAKEKINMNELIVKAITDYLRKVVGNNVSR